MLTLSDVEQKNLEAAFYLTNAQGDFANTSKIDPKQILLTLLTVTEGEKVSDDALYDLFDRKETDSQNVIQYNEDDLKKAAKELLGLELPKYEDQFENIKYKDGKYYMLGCRMKWQEWPYAGALYADIDVDMNNIPFGNFWIEGIGKDGDIYTFKGRTCHLMNDYSYVNEFAYEVVIKDGTLISGKKIKLVD